MEPIQIENLDEVIKKISRAGFGSDIAQAVTEGLASGQSEIRPSASEVIENKRMDFELEIKIKDNKGYYNGFKATFYNENGTTVGQWFKATNRVTVNESYLLMMDQQHPRAVHKTFYDDAGQKYGTWMQLDFSQKTDTGNHLTKWYGDYDLVEKLNDYEFQELNSERQKITAASYMAEGREITLTPVNQEKHSLVSIRANPERGTITIMDLDNNPLVHDQFRSQAARERVQQGKNTKQANVSFVRNGGVEQPSATPSDPNKISGDQKKNLATETEVLKKNKSPRVIQDTGMQKGKSI